MDKNFLSGLGINSEAADTIINRHSDELNKLQLDFAVEREFTKRGVRSIDAAMKLFSKDGLEYSNGTIDGLAEKIDAFQSKNDFLFETNNPKPHFTKQLSHSSGITKSEFDKMGYEKRLRLFNDSPDVYRKLSTN